MTFHGDGSTKRSSRASSRNIGSPDDRFLSALLHHPVWMIEVAAGRFIPFGR
jgi:hypothetical protein